MACSSLRGIRRSPPRYSPGTASGDGAASLTGIDADLSAAGELAPTVAALALLAAGPTRLSGIGHLRGHETDRISALSRELGGMGVEVTELDDGLRIDPAPLRPNTFHTYADHRMVMAGALLALRAPGTVIEDPATVGKTLPQFVHLWDGMLEATEG